MQLTLSEQLGDALEAVRRFWKGAPTRAMRPLPALIGGHQSAERGSQRDRSLALGHRLGQRGAEARAVERISAAVVVRFAVDAAGHDAGDIAVGVDQDRLQRHALDLALHVQQIIDRATRGNARGG